jgi:SlyX protein
MESARKMDENRLIDIETKLAYQEDLLQSLNQLVTEQRDRLDALQATCKLLLERLQEVSEAAGGDESQYEVPPHY